MDKATDPVLMPVDTGALRLLNLVMLDRLRCGHERFV
jgi:hypothetical protein